MRFIAAIAGIILSLPLLVFFWVGTQTFIRASERLLAIVMTLGAGALLLLSVGVLFAPAMQRPQAIVLGLTILAASIIYVSMGHAKPGH